MPQGHRKTQLTFCSVILFFLGFFAVAPAHEGTRWLALFEQTFGDEGLYVVEINPRDADAQTRLLLQQLNSAAFQFRQREPQATIRLERLLESEALRGVRVPQGMNLRWNEEAGFIEVIDGRPGQSAIFGAMLLLSNYQQAATRLERPDRFTRARWQRIFEDPDAPEFLRREILFREFMLEHFHFNEAVEADQIQRNLREISIAVELYARATGLVDGDPIHLPTLEAESLLPPQLPGPRDVRYSMRFVGEAPFARRGDVDIPMNPELPIELRRARARRAAEALPDFPPAIALAARFDRPTTALLRLNQAIEQWPDVPALRIERLAALARARDFENWTPDLEFVLQNFPSAIHLEEIRLAGAAGGLDREPTLRAQVATLIADVRPDLLGPQLEAITALERAGQRSAAQTVLERLAFANPVLARLVREPEK